MNKLNKYILKRNFNKTTEPIGKIKKYSKKLHFVVQHHIASRDHYDLRLEWDGVMKSFAIPNGPSYIVKRLAVGVEDHPLQYRNFEGVIPVGEYGAGTVMIWDTGYWEPINNVDFNKNIKFILYGERLKGRWALIHLKDNDYLLIKDNDDYYKYKNIDKFNTSVKSGKTMNEIGLNKMEITNREKVIFKKPMITKGEIADYYEKISLRMLPYIKNRLISTVRCPNGIMGNIFFMKHFENIEHYLGKKILKNNTNKKDDYYYIKDVSGLIKEVQMNGFEFHIWNSKVNSINKPDIMIFDFDPDTNLSIKKIRKGVKDLKIILDNLKLKSYLKTSGGKGYHVVVKVKSNNWDEHRQLSKDIANVLVSMYPNLYTTNIRKNKRKGKIFIDWIRNTRSSTSVAPYSIRIKNKCAVSMPIKWSELDKIGPNDITMNEATKRLKRVDPWKDFFE